MTLPTTNAVESVGAEQGRRSEEATLARSDRQKGREIESECVWAALAALSKFGSVQTNYDL